MGIVIKDWVQTYEQLEREGKIDLGQDTPGVRNALQKQMEAYGMLGSLRQSWATEQAGGLLTQQNS